MRRISLHEERWASLIPFRIANQSWTEFASVMTQIQEDDFIGRSEARGVFYMDEDLASMLEQIGSVHDDIVQGANRQTLLQLLPPGGARNALDCALWDLQAQQSRQNVWQLAGLSPDPVETVFTIGLEDEPEQMGVKAAKAQHALLKIKLGADRPLERMQAIRKARPDARLVVDANQAWDMPTLAQLAPAFADLDVLMIEQPLARGQDQALIDFDSPLPLCADESCLHEDELMHCVGRYQMINIKLDKCGGLTAGLSLAAAARNAGLRVMVGCMAGTSMAMAPHHVLAQVCDFVDIDGPLLLKQDRLDGLHYRDGQVHVHDKLCWGVPR